jgi:hypothetical protein
MGSVFSTLRGSDPGGRMPGETDFGVVTFRLGRSEQDKLALRVEAALCDSNQLLSNSSPLVINVNGQIGKVTAKAKIRQRTGNTDQQVTMPCRAGKIGMGQHLRNAMTILNRPALAQGGSLQDINKLINGDPAVV